MLPIRSGANRSGWGATALPVRVAETLVWLVTAGPPPEGGPTYFLLAKLMAEDDIEAFLFVFEKIAVGAAWPQAQWVRIWGPYVIEPVQVVLQIMTVAGAMHYGKVKDAILDWYEVLEETHHA